MSLMCGVCMTSPFVGLFQVKGSCVHLCAGAPAERSLLPPVERRTRHCCAGQISCKHTHIIAQDSPAVYSTTKTFLYTNSTPEFAASSRLFVCGALRRPGVLFVYTTTGRRISRWFT